jgi:GntR family transcriptional regulator
MLPFSIDLKPGMPVAEQILFAVKKAVVAGQMRPGDKFPSVRTLSQELKVNPNTAHKVVAALVAEGVPRPRRRSAASSPSARWAGGRRRPTCSGPSSSGSSVEAKKLGLTLAEVQAGLGAHWKKLGGK